MSKPYRTRPYCGAHLDCGEICDCRASVAAHSDDDPDMDDHGSDAPAQAAQPAQNGRQTAAGGQNAAGGRNNQPQPQNGQNGRSGASRGLSGAQLSRMYRKGEDIGWSRKQIDSRIAEKYGLQNPHGLMRAQYDDICNQFDAAKNGGQNNA
ncbi:MAG: hypothetical protein LIO99_10500 [Clostridiales bacterium]|nr:hypothetical protein [Clostridiales bacterium]